jgi:NAD(P)-dependent dehydrogenase (short-subunit alcohol dehydrogenase family)
MTVSLEGRAVLVVGASAGIGRALAAAAVADGARVVLSARRRDRLDDAVTKAGGGHAVAGDACRDGDAARVVAEATALVGPLDLVVYSAGAAPLKSMADTAPDDWRSVLATNVIGAHEVVRAAVPALAPDGVVAVLSSETVGDPRWGLGAYGASKAALEALVRSWRLETPGGRFTCVAVGQTYPTAFGDGFGADELTEAFGHWGRHGQLQSAFMTPEGVARSLATTFAVALAHPDVGVEDLVLRSPSPVAPTDAWAITDSSTTRE